ncbi:MAG: hypothetical protein KBF37_02725 [Saprospiraceae bacterium]|jgi:hypothetical protein|nr:hypothetical protein [Saprospiraceae bacterium]MBP9209213.1 hypothetical protein [Saprospiraceae bacterium]MBV6472990.1 hypothetical protein [Saprospiraceae bacterium]
MQLTRFSRFLIVMLILGGIYLAYQKFSPVLQEKFGVQPTEAPATLPENTTPGEAPAMEKPASSATEDRSGFSYVAPEPVNGRLKGVVELGAAGFNSFIILIDNQKNWKLEKASFGTSLVHENMATDDDIRKGLKEYIRGMLDYGVPGKDIHFVVSSGAKNEPKVVKIANGLKSLGYFVNEVTAQQEGTFGLNCVMPPSFSDQAFMIDMGSGNTKISWRGPRGIQAYEGHGSKYFQKSIPDEEVYKEMRRVVAQIPSANRNYCFIIGGIPYELAKQVRNAKERYTVLKAPGEYKADGEKQRAGLNIYKAIADETGCKNFVFDWDANFTIGFLLGLK